MKNLFKYLVVLLFSMTLIACGSSSSDSGSSGTTTSTSAASLSSTNERDLATAATEGVKAAVEGGSAPLRGPVSRADLNQTVQDHARLLAQTIDVSSSVCSSGTAITEVNEDASVIVTTYSNCSYLDGGVFDGVVRITSDAGDSTTTTTIVYENFTYTFNGETETFNLSATCVNDNTTFESTCTYESDIDGIDNRTYSVSNSSVSGSASSGYTVSATVTDPDHGSFSITTTSPIILDCANGQPSSGVIEFSDSTGLTATVTFNDCTNFTISYDGNSSTYDWPT